METFKIIKVKGSTVESIEDIVVSETPLTLSLGDKELVTLLCTPQDLRDLVKGFLFTSGLIKSVSEIKRITIDQERWSVSIELTGIQPMQELIFKRLYTSGCGRGTLFYNPFDIIYRSKINSDFSVNSSDISSLMVEFQKESKLYLKTGGVHSAAIADAKGIIVFREDIGRHNAIDKVIGRLLAEGDSFSQAMLLTSGRISSEVIFKARRCGIPVVVSRSAPTNQAIRHARGMDIALIGFARGCRMNIYSAENRLRIAK